MTDYEFVGNNSNAFLVGQPDDPTWKNAQKHRQNITVMLGRIAKQGAKSLCVFGAGPCNDIDLKVLCALFGQVTLVDIDSETLKQGVSKQQASNLANLELLDGVDLFGATKVLRSYDQSKDESLMDGIFQAVTGHEIPQLGTYDCVASTCLLSQLLCQVSNAMDVSHARFVDALTAIRSRHLNLMKSALNPGGHALLITDVVSSDSLPELLKEDVNLQETLRAAIARKNFFHGLNPAALSNMMTDKELASEITSFSISEPWRWVAPMRTYCCFAIKFVRSL